MSVKIMITDAYKIIKLFHIKAYQFSAHELILYIYINI